MPDLAMLDYFYGDEAEQFTFYRIPKVLFTDPSYRRISSDAKILYGLMLDRMGLSVRNGWLDEYNRVFIFFTLEDALEYLCCGHTKAVSLFGELDKAGLIERKKQGQGKPTKIYVKNFVRNAEVLTSEKRKSKVPQSGSQDFQKTASNNTEIKDTELSDTEPSIHPARGLPEDKSPAADAMDTMRVYRQIIMENIEYDITRRQLGYDADILDEIVDIMVDTVCSTKPMIRIGGQDFPLEVVKSRLLKLNSEHTIDFSCSINPDHNFLFLAFVPAVICLISASNLQNTVGDEVLTSSITLNNSLNQVLRYIGIVSQQLLGVFRQAVAAGRCQVLDNIFHK